MSIRDGHIGYNEVITLAISFISAKIFFSFPSLMVRKGIAAGWVIVVISTFTAILGWLIIDRLMSRFPGKNLVEVSEEVAGSIFGTILNLIIVLFLIVLTSLVLRQFTETIIATILPQTPISVITFAVLIGILYASYQGVEAISRACLLISPFILAALIALMLGVLPFAQLENLTPVLGAGIPKLLTNGVIQSSNFGEIIILALIYPMIRREKNMKKIGLWVIAVSGVIMTSVVLSFKLVFPYPMAIDVAYPLYQLARIITFGHFIQRVESVLLFIWIFGALLSLSTGFYGATLTLANSLHLPAYRPLLFPMILLLFALSLLAPNFLSALKIDDQIFRTFGALPVFGIPIFLLALSLIRKKRGGS